MPDTIAALSTPPGAGFVGIVRVSGPEAFAVVRAVLPPGTATVTGRVVLDVEAIVDAEGRRCPVSVWFLPGPGSYTGEDLAELHLWGAPVLTAMLLERLLAAGARPAGPGEFTRRAFANGRMDLARAEAVLEVIQARSVEAHRRALGQLGGRLSEALRAAWEAVQELTVLVEAALDFSDQEIEVVPRGEVERETARLREAMAEIIRRSASAEVADALPSVVLTGRTGAGKSSLFNRLVPGARAIVSGLPGTTRDWRAGEAEAGGRRIRVIDTAGYRAAEDEVEREAIARLAGLRERADAVAVVVDGGAGPDAEDEAALAQLPPGRTIRVWNKSDLAPAPAGWIAVSARSGEGVEDLRATIARTLGAGPAGESEAAYLLNVRQRDALSRAAASLDRASEAARAGLGYEFVAYELRGSLAALGEILGRITPEDLLDRIFARFCIGK